MLQKTLNLDHILCLIGFEEGKVKVSKLKKGVSEIVGHQEFELHGEDRFPLYKRAIRALDWLGHIEVSGYGANDKIWASKPSLVSLPNMAANQAIVAGARSPKTRMEVQQACEMREVSVQMQVSKRENVSGWESLATTRILLEAGSPENLQKVSGTLSIPTTPQPGAWMMACASESVEGFEKSLDWQGATNMVPNDANYFSSDSMKFTGAYEKGLSVVRWKSTATGQWIYAMRDGEKAALLPNLEWGRHLDVSAAGASTIRYGNQTFLARMAVPLPRLLARALCLCTGNLPEKKISRTSKGGSALWWAFNGVPLPIAEKICEKIGQEFAPLPKLETINPTRQ